MAPCKACLPLVRNTMLVALFSAWQVITATRTGVQKPHAGSVSRTFSCLSARVHTSLRSSSLKRVSWLHHLLKPGIPSRTPPPRGPPEAAAPPRPRADSLSSTSFLPTPCCHLLSTGITPPAFGWEWGSNQKTVMVQSRKVFVFCFILPSSLT